MPHPEIDFARIRPHAGSRHAAFEELCAQLAFLEDRPLTAEFIRKGSGGDAGVECFVRLPDGSERGWQAKYVFNWNGLSTQLDSSMNALIEKHSQMKEIIICLPFNFPDSRPKTGTSARQKWEAWKNKWEGKAAEVQHTISISLWDESKLRSLLVTNTPAHVGQLFYWFDAEFLTSEWFTEKFDKARAALGSRYTPQTNVELPLRQQFQALARHPFLGNTVQDWSQELSTRSRDALRCLDQANVDNDLAPQVEALNKSLEMLGKAFQGKLPDPDSDLPLTDWKKFLADCRNAVDNTLPKIFSQLSSEIENQAKAAQAASSYLDRLGCLLRHIDVGLDSGIWQLANSRSVLLTGAAGSGKSHLLADFVDHQINSGCPAILVPGNAMIEDDPWSQLIKFLNLPGDLQTKRFLGALDAAAAAASTRAIVCIDAINEHHGPDIWPNRLAGFLEEARQFQRVAIVLSCRTTFVKHIIPDSLSEDRLKQVLHPGFGGKETADRYLEMRGIVRPGAPNLMPEFQNPLFLKTLCDSLEKEDRSEIPHGLRGVSAIFTYYHETIIHSITKRMNLDSNFGLVPDALKSFTKILLDRHEGYAPLCDVRNTFENILPSNGNMNQSLLTQLENEGVLTIEPVQQCDGTVCRMVRFTFERYSDHKIARWLLNEHLDQNDIKQSFGSETILGQFVFGVENYRRAGVIEAIAIQLPELVGTEIIDVGHDEDILVNEAFLDSLLWRRHECFTDRALELARTLIDSDGEWDLFVKIATEPSNMFNADYLHGCLSRLTMPERDSTWSHYLNWHDDKNSPVGVLIDWAWREGMGTIDNDRARLAAVVLGWFLSSSNRAVRDKATKALACLFAKRLQLAAETLRAFAEVDDLYVQERLFAAAYGAALQSKTKTEQGPSKLATTSYELVFANDSPQLNELLRDHARGIIYFARSRGNLTGNVDMDRVRPPHKSPWPIEHVPDSTVESYTRDLDSKYSDWITNSAVHDGDFARYIIDPIVGHWAPVPISEDDCPTEQFLAENWITEFRKSAKQEQQQAFDDVKRAAESLGLAVNNRCDTSEPKAVLAAAELAFEATLSCDVWEAYRVTAMDFVRAGSITDWRAHHGARFNSGWARRWVCKRAHELGWTPERFALLEPGCSHDRNDHKIERIGKKYQWLALHELVARMADNLLFMESSFENETQRPYQGAHEIEFKLRNIDPSLLVAGTHYNGWKQWSSTWWVPVDEPDLSSIKPPERLAWLKTDLDLFNCASLIDLTAPKDDRRWLVLGGFAHWRQYDARGNKHNLERESWYRIRCIVVKKEDREQVIGCLGGQILTDPDSLPALKLNGSTYLGEYPWHPSTGFLEDWIEPDSLYLLNKLPVPIRSTTIDYLCERGGHDYSIEETTRITMPAPWLAKAMKLRFRDGCKPEFLGPDGQTRFFDTSLVEPGFPAALIDKDTFLTGLKDLGLAAIWVIAGEKSVYGSGSGSIMAFGGRVEHTGVYSIGADRAVENVCPIHKNDHESDPEQLRVLLDGGNFPTAIGTK